MKLVYLAMPYRAASPDGILENIMEARKVAKRLWQLGYYVICPHTNTFLMDGVVPDRIFLDGDLEIISRCDAVILGPGWKNSEGARSECSFATEKGIPTYEASFGDPFLLRLRTEVSI